MEARRPIILNQVTQTDNETTVISLYISPRIIALKKQYKYIKVFRNKIFIAALDCTKALYLAFAKLQIYMYILF